jgi:hypothetical protein
MTAHFDDLCRDLLRTGVPVRFRVTGRSMMPTIHDGDALIVAPTAADVLRRGEVALYETPEGVIAHRLIAFGADGALHMRGDAPRSPVERVGAEQVLGRVERLERDGRVVGLRGFYARWSHRLIRLLRLVGLGLRARLRAPHPVHPPDAGHCSGLDAGI